MQLIRIQLEAEVDTQHIEEIENTVIATWSDLKELAETFARIEVLSINDEDGRSLA